MPRQQQVGLFAQRRMPAREVGNRTMARTLRTGLINAGRSSLAVGEVREQGGCVASNPPPPPRGASGQGGGGSYGQDQWGHWKCHWHPPGEPCWVQRWQSPLGGESTGIHSPWRVCHCSTPPTTINLTLRHTKLSPRASRGSSNVACC